MITFLIGAGAGAFLWKLPAKALATAFTGVLDFLLHFLTCFLGGEQEGVLSEHDLSLERSEQELGFLALNFYLFPNFLWPIFLDQVLSLQDLGEQEKDFLPWRRRPASLQESEALRPLNFFTLQEGLFEVLHDLDHFLPFLPHFFLREQDLSFGEQDLLHDFLLCFFLGEHDFFLREQDFFLSEHSLSSDSTEHELFLSQSEPWQEPPKMSSICSMHSLPLQSPSSQSDAPARAKPLAPGRP